MKIFYYAGHPAQFLFFKNVAKKLKQNGHDIILVIRKKDVLENLVKESGFDYLNVLKEGRRNSRIGIIIGLLKREYRLFRIVRQKKPDILMGTDPALTHVGRILKIPVITTLEDDHTVIPKLAKLAYPYTSQILVPKPCTVGDWVDKKIGYEGYMKLAYLHPNQFTPDNSVRATYNLPARYVLIRLASLTAHHDDDATGINKELLEQIITKIKNAGYVPYISSEIEIFQEYKKLSLKIKASDMHSVLAFSSMLICDSQSMSVEAAMLGIPSLRFSSFAGKISVLEELEEKYNLTYGFPSGQSEMLQDKLTELLSSKSLKEDFDVRRQKMLSDKIDVTAFLTWFIENYPESARIMKENPDYQNRFKGLD